MPPPSESSVDLSSVNRLVTACLLFKGKVPVIEIATVGNSATKRKQAAVTTGWYFGRSIMKLK